MVAYVFVFSDSILNILHNMIHGSIYPMIKPPLTDTDRVRTVSVVTALFIEYSTTE